MLNRRLSLPLAVCLVLALPLIARAEPCGSFTLTMETSWDYSSDRVYSWASTERNAFWWAFCGGGTQSEVWIDGYGGYDAEANTSCCTLASWSVEPSFTGWHQGHGKHWWIAPDLSWHLIANSADSVWAEHYCEPPPQGCPIEGSVWDPLTCQCLDGCPLVLDTLGDGFRLTSHADGVLFDLDGDGVREQISWTEVGSDDGWLVLDRNGNGSIDSGRELFGNFTSSTSSGAPPTADHGFQALSATEGPTWQPSIPDGVVDSNDSVFQFLQVWIDRNHDGVSQPAELKPLAALGVMRLDTNFKSSRRSDMHGNAFRLKAQSYWRDEDGRVVRRPFYDVWLLLK